MSNKSEERKTLRTDWNELPIDKELSQILLQIANARAALLNYLEAIPDRATYDSYKDCVGSATDHLLNVDVAKGDGSRYLVYVVTFFATGEPNEEYGILAYSPWLSFVASGLTVYKMQRNGEL